MKAIEKYCVLLEAPHQLSNLIRIKVQVISTHRGEYSPGVSCCQDSQDSAVQVDGKEDLKRVCRLLCKYLNGERPGNLLAAIPAHDWQYCIVFCLKVHSCLQQSYLL